MPFKSEKQRRFMWKFHPDIAHKWADEAKLSRNPLRPHTNTMLPDNAGAFDFLSWNGDERKCTLKTAKESRQHALAGPLLGQFKTITENVTRLTDPNGKSIKLKRIGKGHATTAYQGDDGWVWLVTTHKSGDKSKEILAEMRCSDEVCKHIPYVEKVGFIKKRGGDEDWVFRMPFYRRVKSSDKKAWKQLKELSKIVLSGGNRGFLPIGYREPDDPDYLNKKIEAVENSDIEPSLKQAFIELAEHLQNYGGDLRFEFPSQNLSVDADGNLVLLDVFFDKSAFRNTKRWKNLWKNPPSEGFKKIGRGASTDVYSGVEAIVSQRNFGIDMSKDIMVDVRPTLSANAKRFLPEINRSRYSDDDTEEFIYSMPLYENITDSAKYLKYDKLFLPTATLNEQKPALSELFSQPDLDGVTECLHALRLKTDALGLRYRNDLTPRNIMKHGNQIILLDVFAAIAENSDKLQDRWKRAGKL